MKLGSLFSDGAVLQQKQPIRVWGETRPGVIVLAEIAGKTAYARSSGSGDFLLHLPPLGAGGPFDLTVSVPEQPKETVVLHDVLIGEVWLCSGQSNMSYCLGSDWATEPPPAGMEAVSRQQEREYLDTVCPAPEIRFITVPREANGCREKYFTGSWRPMTRENAPEASAAAAWFGGKLREKLQVPVGLICCAWGGSPIEAWTSPAALRSNPETRPQLEAWEAFRREKDTWSLDAGEAEQEQLSRIARPDRGNTGYARGWAEPGLDDSEWATMEIPGSWIRQGIAGDGAVWVRKKVTIPAAMAGQDLQLKLGGIDKHDIAYFNGVEIGRTGRGLETEFWNQPRCYRIPGDLVRAGENTIAVRAFSFALDGSFNLSRKKYAVTGNGLEIPLAGIWKVQVEYDLGRIEPAPSPSFGIHDPRTPGLLFDSLIRPLLPFAVRGVLWYQGESNAGNLDNALSYQRKLETMIRDWRFHWELPDLPFIQVQLADFRSQESYDALSAWAELRRAQGLACRTLPQVFMVTALTTGEDDDIHPQNKKEVGLRLAASALHQVYHQDVLPGGPVFVKALPEGAKLRVFFQYADGMELKDAPGKSFYLAGADGRYFPAETAEISGDSILLASGQVPEPLSVRYAWSDHPENILWNREYPAAAF